MTPIPWLDGMRFALCIPLICILFPGDLRAGLEPGDRIEIHLRGVAAAEQSKIGGLYRVRESGDVRLPLLDRAVPAQGLSPDALARRIEQAYIDAGIYTRPAVEVEAVAGSDQQGTAVVSVGGQVRRAGQAPYRKEMTLIQALDAVGGRNDFGGRNLILIREGRQICLDFHKLEHKNLKLRPGDSIQVEQKGIIDRWRGSEETFRAWLREQE